MDDNRSDMRMPTCFIKKSATNDSEIAYHSPVPSAPPIECSKDTDLLPETKEFIITTCRESLSLSMDYDSAVKVFTEYQNLETEHEIELLLVRTNELLDHVGRESSQGQHLLDIFQNIMKKQHVHAESKKEFFEMKLREIGGMNITDTVTGSDETCTAHTSAGGTLRRT